MASATSDGAGPVDGGRASVAVLGPGLVAVAALYQVACVFQSPRFLIQHATVLDDAYYYLQVARNLARLGRATFDGLHATSGIQLLWTVALAALATLTDDRLLLLRAALLLTVALNVAAGILLQRLGSALGGPVTGGLAALFWGGFMLALRPTLMGLEYSLHVLIAAAVLRLWWDARGPGPAPRPGRLAGLGVLLTLNYWTRLDSAVYSAAVALGVLTHLARRRPGGRTLLVAGLAVLGPPAAGAVAYGWLSYRLGGTVVPISGLVKAHYAAHHFDGYGWPVALAGGAKWWLTVHLRALLDVPAALLFERPAIRPLGILVALAVVVAAGRAWRSAREARGADPAAARAAGFLAGLSILGAVHALVVVLAIGHFAHITQHYWGWLFLTMTLWVAWLLPRLGRALGLTARRRAAAGALGLFLAVQAWGIGERAARPIPPGSKVRYLDLAAWLDAHLPSGARVGAWNAGILGYFSARPVVNLDGLVNDRAYLDFLRSGRPVEQYLREARVGYLADMDHPDLSMPYRVAWDRSRLFRGAIPWDSVDVLYADRVPPPIFVLRLRPAGPRP